MAKFVLEITETYQRQEIVEAKNEEEAIRILKEKYRNEELILNEDNYITTEFEVIDKLRKRDNFAR